MTIKRDFFYRQIRGRLYPDGLGPQQVEGHDAILDSWESGHAGKDGRFLAYILATAYHETARTMQPVRETLAGSDAEAARRLEVAWKAGRLHVRDPYWRRDADGKYWFGRGLVQLTFKANYEKLGTAMGIDLVGNPDLALTMDVAVKIIIFGMLNAGFTRFRLSDYFNAGKADWLNARRIINGLDRAATIAGYARTYCAALGDGG
jgi:hypothetical protein